MAGRELPDNEALGHTAVVMRLLDAEQMQQALAHDDDTAAAPGAVFIAHGLLTQAQVDLVIAAWQFQKTRAAERRFGRRVVERGWANEEQITRLLQLQARGFTQSHTLTPLADLLQREGLLTPEQLEALKTREQPAQATPDGLTIDITEDRLRASITPGGGPRPSVEAVEHALQHHGVSFGINRDAIAALCSGRTPPGRPVSVAAGIPAQPGRDAVLEYLFDTQHLAAGRQKEDGTIDFRDRGELPQVSAGTPLARKTPPVKGEPGRDIFGNVLDASKPQDRRFLIGNGATLDADQFTVVATTDGVPSLSATGRIAVFSEYRVEGDVDFHTGHVEFRGHVIVTGTIRNGFHVTCGQLTANEAEGAIITAQADVLIQGGIINTQVRSEGAVTAKYLHNAQVEALGDVRIAREVVDSRVTCSGVFHGEHCTVLNARISAKQGIIARNVGSEASSPSHLVFGIDEGTRNELQALQTERTSRREAAEAAASRLAANAQKRAELERAIGTLAQQQDQAMVRSRELQQRGGGGLDKIQAVIKTLTGQLDALFAEQEQLAAASTAAQTEQADAQADVTRLNGEIEALREWSETNPGRAELKVDGTLHTGTLLETPHLETRTSGERKHVWLCEREVTTDEGSEWRLMPKS
jgi:uncharacterized protein (DUF342 family)